MKAHFSKFALTYLLLVVLIFTLALYSSPTTSLDLTADTDGNPVIELCEKTEWFGLSRCQWVPVP